MGLINLTDIAILNIPGADYRCIINEFSKSKPIKLLQKANLNEKMKRHKIQIFFIVCKRWVRKLQHSVILKSKNRNFTAIKIQFCKKM